jgi:hypothetical protein
MSVQELQDEGTMLASKYTDFEFSFSKRGEGTRATAELAIYRQHAAMFGFEADLHMPASLVKEKNGSGARIQMPKTPQPAAKKLSSIELLAKAAALLPAGADTPSTSACPPSRRQRARWQHSGRSGSGGRCSPGLTWGGTGLVAC